MSSKHLLSSPYKKSQDIPSKDGSQKGMSSKYFIRLPVRNLLKPRRWSTRQNAQHMYVYKSCPPYPQICSMDMVSVFHIDRLGYIYVNTRFTCIWTHLLILFSKWISLFRMRSYLINRYLDTVIVSHNDRGVYKNLFLDWANFILRSFERRWNRWYRFH